MNSTRLARLSLLPLVLLTVCIVAPICVSAKEKTIATSNTVDVETRVIAVSSADLDIGTRRVSKSVTWTMGFLTRTQLEQRKRNLVNELCRQCNADVLVDPKFTYKKRILGGGKLIVEGYPARYVNFRKMSQTEIDSLLLSPKYDDDNKVIFINK